MGKNLVVVESPAKAKTINKFLGKNFVVEASMGHIRDLPKRKLGIDVDNNFDPQYQTIRGRGKILAKLRKLAEKSETVYLAPDLDREGEAIAWHLIHALKLQPEKIKRITFNEITKKAINKAIDNAGAINMNKVNAQQARRLLDRIVGYKLSPLLWSKLARGLSAGRVQSVAVRLIVDREKDIAEFKSEEYWTIQALFNHDKKTFKAQLYSIDGKNVRTSAREAEQTLENEEAAKKICAQLEGKDFVVQSVDKKKRTDSPPPPLTTSQLQQRCSTLYNFSAKKTMMIAQQLYEGVSLAHRGNVGLITYMRTDSVRLSDEAIEGIRGVIKENHGDDFLPEKPNHYKSKKSAQEAHEAIRPTSAQDTPESLKSSLSTDQLKVYTLIWKRALACQMAPARIHNTNIDIQCENTLFKAKGREIIFPGYMALLGQEDQDKGEILPALTKDQQLTCEKLHSEQHFTSPPPRYTEASLVRTMESEGIGRPSTYAPTISTIQDRGYVKKKDRKFYATELGTVVTDLLVKHFPQIVDFKFTADMESNLDSVEENGKDWTALLREFYDPFIKEIEKADHEMKNFKKEGTPTNETCQLCKKPMLLLWSRRGRFLGCSGFPDCRNARPWKDGNEDDSDMEDLDLEPCEHCQSPMIVKEGRFGKFISCSKYPECKNTRPMPTGVSCPQEGCQGQLVARRSKKGRPFYGCNQYPKCDFITNKLPDKDKDKNKDKSKDAPETS